MPIWAVFVTIGISLLSPLLTVLAGSRNYGRLEQRVANHDDELDKIDRHFDRVSERDDKQDVRFGEIEMCQRDHGSRIGHLEGQLQTLQIPRGGNGD